MDENLGLREEVESLILELRELGEQRYQDLGGGYTEVDEGDEKIVDEDHGEPSLKQNSEESIN